MAERPTKRPSFQWYPGDAMRDVALGACCLEARGLWREMMDLMHDGEPYGYLTAGGVPIGDALLAGYVKITPRRCTVLLAELEVHGVFSRTEAGVIYSRRMVRDEAKRNVRAAGGPKSLDNPNVPRPKDTRKDGSKDGAKDPPKEGTADHPLQFAVCSLQSADQTPVVVGGEIGNDSSGDYALQITVAANRAVTARWGEQVHPLIFGQSYPFADALIEASVPLDIARASIALQCERSKKPAPPKAINWFREGVLQHYAEIQQRAAQGVAPAGNIEPTDPFGLRKWAAEYDAANGNGAAHG